MDQTFDWSVRTETSARSDCPAATARATTSASNWDGIIGLKGIATLSGNGHWILPY